MTTAAGPSKATPPSPASPQQRQAGQRRELLEVPAFNPLEAKLDVRPPQSKPRIAPVQRSNLLGQLRTFLPQMQAANTQLEQQMQDRPAAEFDIENVSEDEEKPYIEMDLACGVVELRDAASLRAAEQAMETGALEQFTGVGGEPSSSSSDDDDDSDEDLDHDMEEPAASGDKTAAKQGGAGGSEGQDARGRKKIAAKRRPKIEVVGSS